MKWEKLGRIFEPTCQFNWMQKYGILPTPFHISSENKIRVYFGTSAEDKMCKVTFMDLSDEDPTQILTQPTEIVLDLGEPGMFDDSGINPSSVILVNDDLLLYYVGYERSYRRPYKLFPGLARMQAGKNLFTRVKKVPLIDRSEEYPYSLAAPFVIYEENIYKMWLWLAKEWIIVNQKEYLKASIGYAVSENGIDWKIVKQNCIDTNDNEFSIGRPWVLSENGLYKMFYSVRHFEKLYRIGLAISEDGINWTRKDNEAGIDVSESGWDSEMICYPAVIKCKGETYMFYNGNGNGINGFGVARLIEN